MYDHRFLIYFKRDVLYEESDRKTGKIWIVLSMLTLYNRMTIFSNLIPSFHVLGNVQQVLMAGKNPHTGRWSISRTGKINSIFY
jgi:hypothetical protein